MVCCSWYDLLDRNYSCAFYKILLVFLSYLTSFFQIKKIFAVLALMEVYLNVLNEIGESIDLILNKQPQVFKWSKRMVHVSLQVHNQLLVV